ncbi:hypothetical protein FIV34_06065 [Luteibacter pinisoli]|uniref:Glycosyltransferase RgtA/B/C/D-like domain-containing protein n=1 Tax=Luteibacter pinisoli TaxID=2589080 RepID=A0A4Y5Z1Q0_9GAMM|nr:hypothetical protein [Luteibacter pinisoli]QDE38796.1 hypothetical protein FIV34_06065 [Luteibacter pinisoli]
MPNDADALTPVAPPASDGTSSSRAAWIVATLSAIVAIVLRWYFVTHAQVLQPLDSPASRGDAVDYYRYAWNMVHHGIFSSAVPGPTAPVADSFRDPGYPLFLAAWMAAFPVYEHWYTAVLLSQVLLGGITVACLCLAFRSTLRPGFLAGLALLVAAWPHGVSITAYVLSENLTAAIWAATLLAVSSAARKPSISRCILAGLLFACAGLTNAVLVPFVVLAVITLRWKRCMRIRPLVIVLIAAVVPLTAWGVRNTTLATDASSSYRATQNLVQGSWPIYHDAYRRLESGDPGAAQALAAINAEIDLVHADPYGGLAAIGSRIRQHPWQFLGWYASKPTLLWGWDIRIGQGDIYVYPTRSSPYETQPAFKVMKLIAYVLNPVFGALSLGGFVLAISRRSVPVTVVFIAATVVWVTLVYGVLQSEPRYSIPFRGAEIALAGWAIAEWVRRPRPPPPDDRAEWRILRSLSGERGSNGR